MDHLYLDNKYSSDYMDTTKCYQRKSDKMYIGQFVKTEHYYPDGPWRGGVTTHTFQHGDEIIEVYGDISDFEIVI